MKAIKSILLAMILFAGTTYAEDYAAINAKTMIGMESGLANIQKGFLYNNLDLVLYGAEQIMKENAIYHDRKIIKKILPQGKQQMENLAMITSNRIDNAITELKSYIEVKDIRKAHDAYTDIVKACTDCHNIVRGW